jgi:hypothetical protein
VTNLVKVTSTQDNPGTIIGMSIQQLADRRTGLSRLTDEGSQTPSEHPFSSPIPTNHVQTPPERTIESGSGQWYIACHFHYRPGSLGLDCSKSFD